MKKIALYGFITLIGIALGAVAMSYYYVFLDKELNARKARREREKMVREKAVNSFHLYLGTLDMASTTGTNGLPQNP